MCSQSQRERGTRIVMNESLEYVKNQIAKLKDDLQHYTMVEKDSALASQIRYDLEHFETIEEELKAFEILKPYINKIVGMNVYDKDFYECFLQIGKERVFIPKEKYDLLKEVLNYGE